MELLDTLKTGSQKAINSFSWQNFFSKISYKLHGPFDHTTVLNQFLGDTTLFCSEFEDVNLSRYWKSIS